MNKITWKNETRKIEELNPAAYNPRQMTEVQAKQLSTSIERFDLADPIVINANNTIIGGHMRIRILKQRGVSEVDVRVPSRMLTEDEEKELNLRLNKNLGEWDVDLLANFGQDTLSAGGFDLKEISDIFDLKNSEQTSKTIELKPYKMTHILLSFPPEKFSEISSLLEPILKIEGIEYEQSSNG